jgi:hypothetical protein
MLPSALLASILIADLRLLWSRRGRLVEIINILGERANSFLCIAHVMLRNVL